MVFCKVFLGLKTDQCIEMIKNRDSIEGVKVRLDKNISYNGENEGEVLKQALVAARSAGVPFSNDSSLYLKNKSGGGV